VTRRLAILVANDLYETGALSPLLAPKADAEQLLTLLGDPEVGAFEPAEILANRSKPEIERSVERMFRTAKPGDLLLLYYSGHGIRDAMGRLHLAVWNTEPDLLHSTAVSASFIKELLEETQASSVVILLDCCYSGAFSSGLKSRADVDLERELKAGSGVYVLTASTAVELASDGTSRGSAEPAALSVFTDAIVRGIATGAADSSGSGKITAADLWAYVRDEVPKKSNRQSPMQYGYFEEDVHIAYVRGPRLGFAGSSASRVHLGDLLGTLSQTEGVGLRAEEWFGTGRFVVPIGQAIRGGNREDVVFLDLGRADGHLVVVGKVGSGKSTLLRTLVGATALTHSPRDVVFYCLDSGGNRLGSMRGLKPFVVAVAGDDQPAEVRSIHEEVWGHIRDRKRVFRDNDIDSVDNFRAVRGQLPGGPYPDVFLLVDRWGEFAESDPQFGAHVRRIANAGLDYGVHVVVSARSWQELDPELEEIFPSKIELALTRPAESRFPPAVAEQLPPDDPGWAIHRGRRFRVALCALHTALGLPDEAFDDTSDGAADLVSRVTRARIEAGSDVPAVPRRQASFSETGDLLGLLGIAEPAGYDFRRAWADHTGRRRLRVPIGFGADGGPVELDLKEAAQDGMGPHGLVVGATGSGKSELLRTLVLGLAATHSPDALTVVLVDFKGGATFTGLDRLPHTAAVITNLADELSLVDRLDEVLSGELNRRQELLRVGGNVTAQRDYEKARAAGATLAPMPSMLLVVDEFSDLLTARPDFIDLLVQIGRIGRSLGMHLLLASQRLDEGRLRGLDTHLSYRIGLRTFSAMESRVVLGVPDAYELPRSPGHGYLKHGTEPLVRFKAAYVSGVYGDRADVPESGGEDASLMDVLVGRLADRAGPAADPIWLPPLDRSPALDELLGPVAHDAARGLTTVDRDLHGTLRVPVALVDRPYDRRQDTLWLALDGSDGHVAVVGGARSGKSTAIRSLVCALALNHTPAEVQVYCLDFGGGALAALRDLPHVGGVAGRGDAAAVRRTVGDISTLLGGRERRFADLGVDSMSAYRQRRPADDPYGDVFLVVDGWPTLRGEYDDLEPVVTEIATLGLAYGVHVVATAPRWMDFRPSVRDLFSSRIELRLADPTDSVVSRRAAANVPGNVPGRGLTGSGMQLLTAVPGLAGGETTADLVRMVAAGWAGERAPTVRLLPPVLPYADLDRATTAGLRLPIGIAEADLGTVAVDFASEPHFLLFGDAECGKSSFLRALATTVVDRFTSDQARLIFVDYRRSLLGTVQGDHLVGYGTSAASTAKLVESVAEAMKVRLPGPDVTQQQLRERSWWQGPEVFVLVDDYDLVTSGPANPLAALAEYLPLARDVGLHLVVTRRSGGAARALYEPILQRLRELASPGMVMAGDPSEGHLLGAVRPAPLPPGRGQLVTRKDGVQMVQLAYLPPLI
jgi:S-DNA-T family DNA segregation ATPase FtsK/SpoIIIE